MLAVFEVDEFAQIPHLIRMLTTGDSIYQTLRNFAVYLHYHYGYPFYFISALILLPLKMISGSAWAQMTTSIMLWLRQGINVFPMILALILLVFAQTNFKSKWRTVALFTILISVPATFKNNLWWHPDSLAFFFVVVTITFLLRDKLQFRRNFYFAAASCGLAAGTKLLGFFFVLTIPTVLLFALYQKIINWKKLIISSTLFVLCMLLSILISNPLLFLPLERAEIIQTQILQFQQISFGNLLIKPEIAFSGGYPVILRDQFGLLAFVLLAIISVFIGLTRNETRFLNLIILSWMIPIGVVTIFVATLRTHYLIPFLLPAFSSLNNLFPERNRQSKDKKTLLDKYKTLIPGILLLLIGTQFFLFTRTNINQYTEQINREAQSLIKS
ncbi:MAG: hypothetical protein JEZ06_21130 [Anaerolineaceae bacterium]|nr:hypothetical protein [Anaerolineaceae bacterium]